ncbi:hypothetical protein [Spirosoma lituiforme]
MSKIPRTELRSRFQTGKVPTQQDWDDFFDSFVHKDEQTAVDQQVVNTRIATYDTALKARQPDGTISTLGDVFAAFEGYPDNRFLAIDLKWPNLQGKPASVNVQWTEQTIVTDSTTYNPTQAGVAAQQRWLGSQVAGLTSQFHIVDLKTERRFVGNGVDQGYFTDCIIAVKLAIAPKVNL